MANSLSALNQEFWDSQMQETLYVENNAIGIANMRFVEVENGGYDTVNRVILNKPQIGIYTPGTDVSYQALSATNEQLTISTWKYAATTVDDTEKKQSAYEIGAKVAQDMQRVHNNYLEQSFLSEVTNSTHTVDAGSVGGSAGSYISLNTDNVPQVFTAAGTKLWSIDVRSSNRYAIIGPHFYETLLLQSAGRPTGLGDTVTVNGRAGERFGWNIIVNNNLPYTAVLSMVTQPTNGDTITIAGVTITLHATLIASAWADIRTNVDTTRSFIRDLINYGNGTGGTVAGTVGTDFTDVATEDRYLWQRRGLLAVNDDTADTLTITGYGDVVCSETLTDATDSFTSKKQESLFCVAGAVDMVVQINPKVEVSRVEKQFADQIKSLSGHGKKTYADGARKMVRVKNNAADWV
nr:hypothetical protein [uncultured bacterium]